MTAQTGPPRGPGFFPVGGGKASTSFMMQSKIVRFVFYEGHPS